VTLRLRQEIVEALKELWVPAIQIELAAGNRRPGSEESAISGGQIVTQDPE
jgi:hypothetical protein